MRVIIYRKQLTEEPLPEISSFYTNNKLLTKENGYEQDVDIINPWWWLDQICKDNEIIHAEIIGTYLIYMRLTPDMKPKLYDHPQYKAILTIWEQMDFNKYDYIIKCTW